jgi:hypothetical protein
VVIFLPKRPITVNSPLFLRHGIHLADDKNERALPAGIMFDAIADAIRTLSDAPI